MLLEGEEETDWREAAKVGDGVSPDLCLFQSLEEGGRMITELGQMKASALPAEELEDQM